MCFITVSSLFPAVFFFSIGAFLFSMPIVIYLPSSSLRPSRPPLGQARSFPGALVNSIYQHPISKWYSLQSDQLDQIWPRLGRQVMRSECNIRLPNFGGTFFRLRRSRRFPVGSSAHLLIAQCFQMHSVDSTCTSNVQSLHCRLHSAVGNCQLDFL